MEAKEYGPTLQDEAKPTTFLQTIIDVYDWLSCWILTLMLFGGPVLFIYMCITPSLRIFALLYLLWVYYDRETIYTGGRRIKWLRKMRVWKYRRDYFPIKLVKTADLPPDTTYLFASFPHGMFVIGASTNFCSDVNHFDEAFPGLTPYMHMQNDILLLPIAREMLLFYGICSVSAESILHVLNGPAGNVSIVTVGGYIEMMKSVPGTNRVVLKTRKGFVRMALKAGSSLVPVYTFGESSTYDQLSSDWYVRLQKKLHSLFWLGGLVLAWGPCKIDHALGLLPYQIPLTTVVGSPIKLPRVEDPSSELVDKYHQIYIQELTSLFDKYKGKYDSRGEKAFLSVE
ncbi:acyl-CoA wax alcohol acyltransferase 1-like isoform X2 [Planococcus citri]|uniref:acyl-CoA wax alcohol acyltransferase 1-like isoform X2 n=1 Tax=Planococcus citri TaxID=170843 RepID=UPI0031F869FF